MYLIDAGSSSVKVYFLDNDRTVRLLKKKSYKLINTYTKENKAPIDDNDAEVLIALFIDLQQEYQLTRSNTKIYATGHFRYIENALDFVREFSIRTNGLYFNIVSQELETFYQDNKFMPYSKTIGRTMVITIGGGSIQITFYEDGRPSRLPVELNWGTNFIKEKFDQINEVDSKEILYEIIDNISEELPHVNEDYPIAIFTGGEKTFMELAGYPLETNTLSDDEFHPYIISMGDYVLYNEHIFQDMSLDDLINLMPENPGWMKGARTYSSIAQAICMRFGVEKIIPSDCNTIDGVIEQEVRNVVVCGSFNKHLERITQVIAELKRRGIDVLSPKNTEVVDNVDGFVLFRDDEMRRCKFSVELKHLKAIEKCDEVIVCNFDNFIGSMTAREISWATCLGKKVVFLEDSEILSDYDWPSEIGML